MATSTVPDVPSSTHPLLLSLPPEDRRKIILESLQAGYPRIPEVFRPATAKVSRYVSQFTSGRWRDRIWTSDGSDVPENETATPETEPRRLVIYGYDLQCDDYAKERDKIARWDIVERELHFPNLEKGYVEKRDAKTKSEVGVLEFRHASTAKDANVAQEPMTEDANVAQEPMTEDAKVVHEQTTKDVHMEESRKTPQNVLEGIEASTKVSGQESSEVKLSVSRVQALPRDIKVVEQGSLSSVSESKPIKLDSNTLAPGEIEASHRQESMDKKLVPNSGSSIPLEGKKSEEKMATVSEDSKVVGSSETELKTSEVISPAVSVGQTSVPNTEASVLLKESEDVKDVLTVHNLRETKSFETEMETTSNRPESGDKSLAPNSKNSAVLEIQKSPEEMKTTTVPGNSEVANSEKAMETSATTLPMESSDGKSSVKNSKNAAVVEVKDPADKMVAATIPEHSKVARTSETDTETSGISMSGKRKADSSSMDDPDEKRTKKTSVEK